MSRAILQQHRDWRVKTLTAFDPSRNFATTPVMVQHREADEPYGATLLHPRALDPEGLLEFNRDFEVGQHGATGDDVEPVWVSLRPGEPPHRLMVKKPHEGRHEIVGGLGGQWNGLHLEGLLSPQRRQEVAAQRLRQSREQRRIEADVERLQSSRLSKTADKTEDHAAPQVHLLPLNSRQAVEISRIRSVGAAARAGRDAGQPDVAALRRLDPETFEHHPDPVSHTNQRVEQLVRSAVQGATDETGEKPAWVQRFIRHGEPTVIICKRHQSADALYRALGPLCRVGIDHDHVDPITRVAARIGFDPASGRDPDHDVLIASRPELLGSIKRPHHLVHYDAPPTSAEPDPRHISQHVLVADTTEERRLHGLHPQGETDVR